MASFITAGNATNGLQVSSDNTGILELRTGTGSGTTAVTVNASQNVGFGTSSPGARLQVTDGNFSQLYLNSTTTVCGVRFGNTGSTNGYIYYDNGANLALQTNGAERVRIDASGNLLVNTTARTGSERMALWYSSNSGPGLNIRDTSAQNGNTFIQFSNGATTAGAITSNGTTTMTYGSASDYRLKENLVPLTGALAKVAALQPKAGNWKVDGSEFVGFIAHELQEVFPDSVVGEKDKTDAEGNPEYQMVDTGSAAIIATLTAAIQEQQAMIEEMKAEIAALKGAA